MDDYKYIFKKAVIVNACDPQIYWEIRRRRYRGQKGIMEKVLSPIFKKGGGYRSSPPAYTYPFHPLDFGILKIRLEASAW